MLEGCVDEIQIKPGMTEEDLLATMSTGTTGSSTKTTSKSTGTGALMTMHGKKTNASNSAAASVATTVNNDSSTAMNTITNECSNQQEHNLNEKMKSIDANTMIENQQETTSSSKHKTNEVSNRNDTLVTATTSSQSKTILPTTTSINNIEEQRNKTVEKQTVTNESSQPSSLSSNSYIPYSKLKGISDITQLPPTVDPLHREESLSDQEFCEIFGMNKDSFYKLPTWKQVSKKKEKLLF